MNEVDMRGVNTGEHERGIPDRGEHERGIPDRG
jgi:hypothetical protein